MNGYLDTVAYKGFLDNEVFFVLACTAFGLQAPNEAYTRLIRLAQFLLTKISIFIDYDCPWKYPEPNHREWGEHLYNRIINMNNFLFGAFLASR